MIEEMDNEDLKLVLVTYLNSKKKTKFRTHIKDTETGKTFKAIYKLPRNWGYYSEHFKGLMLGCNDGIMDEALYYDLNNKGVVSPDDWKCDTSLWTLEKKEKFQADIDTYLTMKHKRDMAAKK